MDQKELKREEQFWDGVGEKWLKTLSPDQLRVESPYQFLSGSSRAFDDLMERMGQISSAWVLDYGCGSGWLSTYLAKKGAMVEGFDISRRLVELGMWRAETNGVKDRVRLRKMIAEQLEYPDGAFDYVVGISILHHIHLGDAGKELCRVLKPGGKALFIEPLGESRFVDGIRNYLFRVHHGQVREVDAEHPLLYADIHRFGKLFSTYQYREFQLTEMIARVTGDRFTRFILLDRLDDALLRFFPRLKKFCRLVVLEFTK